MCHLLSSLALENWRIPKNISCILISFCSSRRSLEDWFRTYCQCPPTNVRILFIHVMICLCPHTWEASDKLRLAKSCVLYLVFISCLKLPLNQTFQCLVQTVRSGLELKLAEKRLSKKNYCNINLARLSEYHSIMNIK